MDIIEELVDVRLLFRRMFCQMVADVFSKPFLVYSDLVK